MVRTKLKYVVRTHLYELYAYLYNVGNHGSNQIEVRGSNMFEPICMNYMQ